MRHRPRPVRRLGALSLFALAAALASAGATSAAAPASADITVKVTGLRSSEGVVRACMTTQPDDFPKCTRVPGARSAVVPAEKTLTLTFRGVPPGRYAIALLHDENDNGKVDRVLGMMPKEGFGFSRDAKVHMGPPKFDEAAFEVVPGASVQTIHMRYML